MEYEIRTVSVPRQNFAGYSPTIENGLTAV